MTDILVGLGANEGDRLAYLRRAVMDIGRYFEITQYSSLYHSEPYGYEEQNSFLNAVIAIKSNEKPQTILQRLLEIEQKMGRIREFKWGPRIIDCDIIFFGNKIIRTDTLTVPHADFQNRDFVLIPAAEVWPEFIPPGFSLSLKTMAEEISRHSSIEVMQKKWMR